MANQSLKRFMVRGAILLATQLGKTPTDILQGIVLGKFKSEASTGTTVISSNEGGGSTGFSIPSELGPAEVAELAEQSLTWVEGQPDPTKPNLPPRIMRVRASFSKAVAT